MNQMIKMWIRLDATTKEEKRQLGLLFDDLVRSEELKKLGWKLKSVTKKKKRKV